jgi:pilus assembly protein CpaC
VIEVRKSFLRNLGIQWPEAASISLNNNSSTEELWTNIHGFETNGDASLLASPNILCKSHEEAEFVAGGEFPIKIINGKLHDVIWKKYGILVKFKPIADFSGHMNIEMESEISQIDGSITVDGIPGLTTHKIKSEFDLFDSQTILLSGLIRSDQSKSAEGIPFLKDIPILGNLFKSQLFKNNESELIVLVRPEIQNNFATEKSL